MGHVGSSSRQFVTNSHCTSTWFGYDGSLFGQNSWFYRLGVEVQDVNLWTGVPCQGSAGCRFSDAALISYDTASVGANYLIAHTTYSYSGTDQSQNGSLELGPWPFYVVGELSDGLLPLGRTLSKVGSTSGWTTGVITDTCGNKTLPNGGELLCQYTVSSVGKFGDSGSPVFAYEAATNRAWLAGVVIGGTFVFSSMDGIRGDLGSMTVSSSYYYYPPQVSIQGPYTVGPYFYCVNYQALVQGGEAPFQYIWSGLLSGQTQEVSGTISTTGNLVVDVYDGRGSHAQSLIQVVYDPNLQEIHYCD